MNLINSKSVPPLLEKDLKSDKNLKSYITVGGVVCFAVTVTVKIRPKKFVLNSMVQCRVWCFSTIPRRTFQLWSVGFQLASQWASKGLITRQ